MSKRDTVVTEGKRLQGQLYYSQQDRYNFNPGGSADCSSFYQHCLQQVGINPGDWTGAQLQRGRKISQAELLPGDAVFYGIGTSMQHVALYIGGGKVLSHGGPGMGPVLVPYNYRGDIGQYRRYIEEEGSDTTSDSKPASWKGIGTATCTANGVNVRQAPDGTVQGQVNHGNRFEVDGAVSGSWVHVYVAGIGVGYIHADYVQYDGKPITPDQPKADWKATGTAICTANGVNIRQTPGGTVIGQLGKGNRFEVDGATNGEWVHIKVAGFGVCWISRTYVKYDSAAASEWKATGTAVSTGDDVNVRSTPNEANSGNIIGKLNKGNRFEVNGETSGDWVRVKVANVGIGYVHKNWVKND